MLLVSALAATFFTTLLAACASTPVRVTRDPSAPAPQLEALRAVASEERIDETAACRRGVWDPAYFDTLIEADDLSIEGFRQRHQRSLHL